MTKQNTEDSQSSYSFVLKRIDLIEKSLNVYYKKEKKIEYDYQISLRIAPSPEENQSLHLMSVTIIPKGNEKDILATVTLAFTFTIFDLQSIAKVNEDGIALPDNLLNLLNAVVIGTMRGVLYSELRGTPVEDAILPVLDPSKFQREAK